MMGNLEEFYKSVDDHLLDSLTDEKKKQRYML